MTTVVLIIHLMIAAGLVAVILFQRSEGGALGIGGGGGNFMSGRGSANLLTRTTSILGAAFFATSIILTILANRNAAPTSILDGAGTSAPAQPGAVQPGAAQPGATQTGETPAPATGQGILDKLKPAAPQGTQAPQSQ